MKLYNSFTIENEEQIGHFLDWRELYDPPCYKLFSCTTEVYHDADNGKSYYRTLVDVFIKDDERGNALTHTTDERKEMPGLPKDEEPDPVPQG